MTTVIAMKGGYFDDEKTKDLAKKVANLSCVTFFFYIVQLVTNIVAPTVADTSIILTLVPALIGLLIFGLVMWCGYSGAVNGDRQKLCWFAACSGLCAVCSFISYVLIAAVGIAGFTTCSALEEFGISPVGCYFSLIFGVILTILFILNTFYGCKLYNEVPTFIVLPAAKVGTAPVTIQDV